MVLKFLPVMLAACLSFGAAGMAVAGEGHDHDHEGEEHEEEFDLDLYQLVLKGDQGFGEACYLGVLEQGFDTEGRYFAVVETSFSHEGEGPGRLIVTLDATLNPTLLRGDNGRGEHFAGNLADLLLGDRRAEA